MHAAGDCGVRETKVLLMSKIGFMWKAKVSKHVEFETRKRVEFLFKNF